jgi:hypothetical protein
VSFHVFHKCVRGYTETFSSANIYYYEIFLKLLYQMNQSKTKKFNHIFSAEVLDKFIHAVEINTRDALISVRSA